MMKIFRELSCSNKDEPNFHFTAFVDRSEIFCRFSSDQHINLETYFEASSDLRHFESM